ncbi:kinase isozyme mitochondrial precursor [Pyrenophora seminiperda CCB06]|uniref:Kinase isozyme mitochondrial n=1 Tax=Pyrenophora seminiperda CCB06 TaxID=1302712 RepID=A0A3M7M6N7_9PLEO|nr:kinase isozyme mitochondrial precursor [Pyrenophora seminiperda CCB06]
MIAGLVPAVGFWTGRISHATEQYPDGLTAIFSTHTIDALNQDPRLRSAILSLTEAIAHSSTDLGERFRSDSLKNFGTNLTDGISYIRGKQEIELKKRGFFDDLSNLFGSLTSGGNGGVVPNARGAAGPNLADRLGDLLSGLGNSIGLNLTSGLDNILGNLDQPALFLGVGLGVGATTSLNLTNTQETNKIVAKVAAANNASATGINLIAQQLGNGVSSSVAPALGSNTNISLGPAAYSLALGIGNATAKGLGLTQQKFLPSNASGIEAIAGNIGLGVAGPLVSNIDFQALMKNAGGSTFMQQLPQIAAAAGMGLGEGAKDGLRLASTSAGKSGNQKRQASGNPSMATNVSEVVGVFAKGLSQSFIEGSNFSSLTTASMFTNMVDFKALLQPLSAGVGAGIGSGAAIGLGFKAADSEPVFGTNMTGNDQQTAMVAESFTQNLVANFLINSTALEQAQKSITDGGPNSVFKNVDAAKAAEGFARGTIEGILSALASVGGINNLINGTIPANAIDNVPVLKPTKFNDSVDGSAVGFARGLTGKGTILVAEIARNLTRGPQNTIESAAGQKRSVSKVAEEASVVADGQLSPRQLEERKIGGLVISARTAEVAAQTAIDTLTCPGIGGLASTVLGLRSALKADPSLLDAFTGDGTVPLDGAVLRALPKGPITLYNDGNNFEVELQTSSIKVNGLDLMTMIVVTALHIAFAGIGFLLLLPLYLTWGAAWRFSVIAGYPINEAKNLKWRMWFLVLFAVFSFVGIIFGIVGIGNSGHFRDTHSIFGLVTLIFLFPTVVVTIIRLRTHLPHPSPSAFSGYKGPLALAKSPQRIYLISGVATQLLLSLGQLVVLQGFTTLRSVFLCVIDAFFDSITATTVVSIIVMVQISATAIIAFRAWLEQHIASREAKGETVTSSPVVGMHKRSDTMATFGFEKKGPPPALDLTATRPRLPTWEVNALRGEEQIGISTPFNIMKDGSIHELESKASPFVSVEEQQHYQERGIYTPKTGGYVPVSTKARGLIPPVPSIPFPPRSAGLPSSNILGATPTFTASAGTPTPRAAEFIASSPAPPRTAGLTMSRDDDNSDDDDYYLAHSPDYAENRPSSDVFDNARSPLLPNNSNNKNDNNDNNDVPPLPTEPKTANVSTADLWPPPKPTMPSSPHPGNKVSNSLLSTSAYGGADYVFPNQTNVSTADLFPPPNPDYERIAAAQRTQLQSQKEATAAAARSSETSGSGSLSILHRKKGSKDSAKSARQRESRPMDGNVPVRDSFMGFENGR